MANNYSSYSFIAKSDTEEQQKELIKAIEKRLEYETSDLFRYALEDDFCCGASYSIRTPTELCIYSELEGNLEAIVKVIVDWQQKQGVKAGTVASCAYFCDKPRPDDFAGVAVTCFRGKSIWFDATAMAYTKLSRLEAKHKKGS